VSFAVEVLDDAAQAPIVSIDCAQQHQRICGLGFHTDPADPNTEFYVRGLGASVMRLSLLENQIEPVPHNSDPNVLYEGGLDRKVFDFDRLRQLQAAGIESFIVNSFSPPAWMKTNMSTNYQGGNAEHDTNKATNRLDLYQYDEFAKSMVGLVRVFREENVNLMAIGFQNEPAFDEPYASAILDPSHFVELIKVTGRRFDKEGIHTRLFMPEEVFAQTESLNAYIAALTADPEAQKHCDAVACHFGYGVKDTATAARWQDMWKRAQAGSAPEELWVSETGLGYGDWPAALSAATALCGALEAGNLSLWATLPPAGRLARRDRQGPALDVWAPFFRHIRPGAVRVTSTSSVADVLATSYVNDAAHGGALASVLINTASSARTVRLAVKGRPAPSRVTLTRTDRVNHDADIGGMAAGDVLVLPPSSVTTVVQE
jgi:O-glycosyl hydrolase